MANDSSANAQSKLNRRNRSKQIQLRKRQSLLSAVSIFGGVDGAPRIVAVIPLCEDVDSHSAVSALSTSLGLPDNTGQENITKIKFVSSPFFLVVLLSSSSVY
jgi:pre-rRNA-processing protein TSR1